ncbi:MAG: 16S rRNA (guanine(966)-N(2))-methyltransferase RsmD [Oxalobacter formigenes]|nr:16S rRNA (guanine(966)-N(2))-methyltransferase RsmD [Oxalobacter formigenes]
MRRRSSAKNKEIPSGLIRIIGGQWKRSLLPVCADVPGLRPTPNRVRETVFNWLAAVLGSRWPAAVCLDLFAGTGAFGFEAASRGVNQVMMVETHKTVFACLKETCDRFQAGALVTLVYGDALQVAARLVSEKKEFDVIFLDPPFSSGLLQRILPCCLSLLKDGGVVYIESPSPLEESILENQANGKGDWHIIRQGRAGQVCYHLLQFRHSGNLQA